MMTAYGSKAFGVRKFIALSKLRSDVVFERLKERINKAPAVAITFDTWTSMASDDYLAVTAHFISPEKPGVLESRVVEFTSKMPNHTAETLARVIESVLDSEVVPRRLLVGITSDGDAAARRTVHSVAVSLPASRILRMRCKAHHIAIAVKHSFAAVSGSVIEIAVDRVAAIAHFFNFSGVAHRRLKEVASECGMQCTLLRKNATRWTSLYAMLERYCDMHEIVTATAQSFATRPCSTAVNMPELLNQDHLTIVCGLQRVLHDLNGLIVSMQVEQAPWIFISRFAILRIASKIDLIRQYLEMDETAFLAHVDITKEPQLDKVWRLRDTPLVIPATSRSSARTILGPKSQFIKFVKTLYEEVVIVESAPLQPLEVIAYGLALQPPERFLLQQRKEFEGHCRDALLDFGIVTIEDGAILIKGEDITKHAGPGARAEAAGAGVPSLKYRSVTLK